MSLIECTLGPVQQHVNGTTYQFQRDQHGRFVAEVHSLVDRALFLSVTHYREPGPIEEPKAKRPRTATAATVTAQAAGATGDTTSATTEGEQGEGGDGEAGEGEGGQSGESPTGEGAEGQSGAPEGGTGSETPPAAAGDKTKARAPRTRRAKAEG